MSLTGECSYRKVLKGKGGGRLSGCAIVAVITLIELVRATLLSLVLGWLFADMIPPMLGAWQRRFWLALVSVAPAVLLHELAHKLVGLGF